MILDVTTFFLDFLVYFAVALVTTVVLVSTVVLPALFVLLVTFVLVFSFLCSSSWKPFLI